MDPTTIPQNIWDDCSRNAEALMVRLFSTCNHDEDSYRKKLQEQQYKNLFRSDISSKFYSLYSSANKDLAYTTSDLVTGDADPGWRDFLEIANNNRATPPTTAEWIADNLRNACKQCGKAFGTFTRKHHCRLCGDIFCDTHSRQRMLVTNPLTPTGRETGGLQRNERVCDACHRLFAQAANSPLGKMKIQENKPGVEIEKNTRQVRPWQYITPGGKTEARIQFVVNTGGGVVLFSRLNRAFQEYFHTHPHRKQSFMGYKVFSEEFGNGRSDSAVVYLCVKSDHQDVTDWWQSAVSGNADFRSSLQTEATAYGLRNMGNGGWAIDLPKKEVEVAELGASGGGSAGGFIGNTIGVSFWLAAKAREQHRVNQKRKSILADPALGNDQRRRLSGYRSTLVAEAKNQLGKLVARLRI